MAIEKRYEGDLDATGRGEMLATRTDVEGSAGYVAMEKVTGTLHGKGAASRVQHSGTMDRGAAKLSVTVVPDSGSGELAGLTGTLAIIIEGRKHSYDFNYTLPEGP